MSGRVGWAATHDYAGWWARVAAYVLDVVVLAVAIVAVVGAGFALSFALGVLLAVLALVVGWIGYWTFLEGGARGQTLGKRVVGIKVVAEDGGRAGYGRALGRTLVARVIWIVPLAGLVDVLWPLWDARSQCLHDKAGSTLVVRA